MRLLYFCFSAMALLAGCATNGDLVVSSHNGKTGEKSETIYSRSFDGADWAVADRLGFSVVVDSAVPKSSNDSFADCTVVVYLWNLSSQPYKIKSISVGLNAEVVNKVSDITAGAGPNTRTLVKIGQGRVFVYGTSTIADVLIELDGQVIKKQIRLVRRTEDEIKRYWGSPSSRPPYPWFATKPAPPGKADAVSY